MLGQNHNLQIVAFVQYMRKNRVLSTLGVIAGLLLVMICIMLLPRQHTVNGLSMEPTLNEGDSLYYTRYHMLDYGDLIVFQSNEPKFGLIVKRVIGFAGDRIQVNADGTVIRNGEPLMEPYIETDTNGNSAMEEIVVAQDRLFVLGDNRAVSIDSRDARIGQIPVQAVCGTVLKTVRYFDKRISQEE